ncbi:hypothetical protein [Corallococcus sp. 4LFB]
MNRRDAMNTAPAPVTRPEPRTLESSHSPFASQPQKLAAMLDGLR